MNKTWLRKEGAKWVSEGIVSEEQMNQILTRYKEAPQRNLLPLLASVLIAVGILSFIASNWQGIPEVIRIAIISIIMVGFYIGGQYVLERGSRFLGIGLISLGIISFGAGIILIGQMFHLLSYDARLFIIWAIVALLTVYLIESRLLLLLAMLIIVVGQLYSLMTFSQFSYILAGILLFGAGHFVYHRDNQLSSIAFSLSVLITMISFTITGTESFQWIGILSLGLYVAGDLIRKKTISKPIQIIALLPALFLIIFHIFFLDIFVRYEYEELPTMSLYLLLFLVLTGVSAGIKFKQQRYFSILDLSLFLPLFFLVNVGDVFYLLLLFMYAIASLVIGYRQEESRYVNMGTVLFLVSVLIGYIQLAWDFMPKSLFFLIGGICLFILSLFLEKRRRVFVGKAGGHNEK